MSLLFTVTGLMTFLTEFTSNTATTEMMLPIVAGLTNQIQINPCLYDSGYYCRIDGIYVSYCYPPNAVVLVRVN
jgi:di/tricarboxylate transporter